VPQCPQHLAAQGGFPGRPSSENPVVCLGYGGDDRLIGERYGRDAGLPPTLVPGACQLDNVGCQATAYLLQHATHVSASAVDLVDE